MSSPWWSYVLFWGEVFTGAYLGMTVLDYVTGGVHEFFSDKKNKMNIASRTVTMGHALGAIYYSSRAIIEGPRWNIVNTDLQNHLLGMSLGYFIYDLVYLNLFEYSLIYNGHHLLSIGCAASQFWSGLGGYHAAVMLLIAEITNPVQITWDMARRYRKYPLAKQVFEILTPIYCWFFMAVRAGLVPIASVYHVWQWHSEPYDYRLPYFWTFLSISLNLASYYWCWLIWRKYINKEKISLGVGDESKNN